VSKVYNEITTTLTFLLKSSLQQKKLFLLATRYNRSEKLQTPHWKKQRRAIRDSRINLYFTSALHRYICRFFVYKIFMLIVLSLL